MTGNSTSVGHELQRHVQRKRRIEMAEFQCSYLIYDVLIVVQLIGTHARTSLKDRGHIVVPFLALFRLVPLNRPAKITRVDVGGETRVDVRMARMANANDSPMLEAVKLVRADEVHLACQDCLVALASKVVGVGRDLWA